MSVGNEEFCGNAKVGTNLQNGLQGRLLGNFQI